MSIEEEKINRMDPMAWAKKYLIAASEVILSNLMTIRGISIIKLISKPNQDKNHELEEQAKIVPSIKKM